MGDPYSSEGCAWSSGYRAGLDEAKEIIEKDKKIREFEDVIKKIKEEMES